MVPLDSVLRLISRKECRSVILNAIVGVVPEWQVTFCGLLLVIMAVGNFANTVQTLMAKSRFKAKMKS